MDNWWSFGEGSGLSGSELSLGLIPCAFCSAAGNFKREFSAAKKHGSSGKELHYEVLCCGNCGNLTMCFWSGTGHGSFGLHNYKLLPWPLSRSPAPSTNWPKDVSRYWVQAKQGVANKTWDAALLMARSALQIALRESSAVGKTLKDEIDDLAKKGLLPPNMKDWAHELRLIGNESAHPTIGTEPPPEPDVRDVVEFLDYLLRYLFDLPATIKAYRQRKSP